MQGNKSLFLKKSRGGGGGAFIRAEAFNRINMVVEITVYQVV